MYRGFFIILNILILKFFFWKLYFDFLVYVLVMRMLWNSFYWLSFLIVLYDLFENIKKVKGRGFVDGGFDGEVKKYNVVVYNL